MYHQDLARVIVGAIFGLVAVLVVVIVIPLVLVLLTKRGTMKWKGEAMYNKL